MTNALGSAGFRVLGPAAGSSLGVGISAAGDFNGDGIDDFIVGLPGYYVAGRSNCGAAVVIFGNTTGWVDISLSSFTSGAAGLWLIGPAAGAQTGYTVGAAGDVNGDGRSDIIVGSPLMGAGAAHVIFGRAEPYADIDLASFSPSATNGFIIYGTNAGDRFGLGASGAGDINGDGSDDVIVGAYVYDGLAGNRIDAGAVYLVFGRRTGVVNVHTSSMTSSQGFRIVGAADGDLLGLCTTGAGDFNDDGYDDIVFGAHLSDPLSRGNAGAAYVIFGHSNATVFPDIDLATFTSGTAGFRIIGAFAYTGFGWSVAGGLDVNADGISDVVIGAPFPAAFCSEGLCDIGCCVWRVQWTGDGCSAGF
jgi:hypothetical protein